MNSRSISFPFFPVWRRVGAGNVTVRREALLTMSQRRVPMILSLALVFLMIASVDPALALTPAGQASRVHSQTSGNRGHAWRHPGDATPKVYGKTIGNWGHAWWQWALNFATADNPILQDGVVDCSAGQSGNVWFLAGTFGGAAERTCTIKKGKAIFFPLFNGIWWTPLVPNVPEDCTDEASCRGVSVNIDALTSWTCTVDGTPCVWSYQIVRAQSDARPFNIPAGSIADTDFGPVQGGTYEPGLRRISIADGYWVMLDPLPRGQHTIHFTAATADGDDDDFDPDFSLDVTYQLRVD